ncbi:hypothetical protein CDAR_264371 [Caerostris darwini]|uniref:Ribosomal protein L2 n=1 Tax=Caerostris darwini TaxID=1538125 RepID=A0AAV4Q6C7_9ARAC|nr:hypothetical protein CDAR_264371 [Caerostris darwini]
MKRKRYPRTARGKHRQRNPSDYRNYWRGGEAAVGSNGFECSIATADSWIPTVRQKRGLLEMGGGGSGMEIITHVAVGQLCWVRSFKVHLDNHGERFVVAGVEGNIA